MLYGLRFFDRARLEDWGKTQLTKYICHQLGGEIRTLHWRGGTFEREVYQSIILSRSWKGVHPVLVLPGGVGEGGEEYLTSGLAQGVERGEEVP